jgi:cell division protein FtsI (penicillin-binding protein 3)
MKRGQYAANPLLKLDLPQWRSRLVLFVLLLGFVALLLRAFFLQGFKQDFLQHQGEIRYARTLELPATRGKILDRNGQVLATSLPVKALWAIPEDVTNLTPERLTSMAKLLGMTPDEILKPLKPNANKKVTFVYIKRQVDSLIADQVMALGINGIYTKKEYKRFYPESDVMAHILGFTNVEDLGQEGMELAKQKELAGKSGSRRVIKDRLGQVVEDVRDVQPPQDGKDFTLSIDSKLQYLTHNQLKKSVEENRAKAGAAVILDIKTGEILALANLPTYNPNNRSKLTGEQIRNRVLTDTYEPGSVMKPFPVALALEMKKISPGTYIDTYPGTLKIGTATISDAHPHGTLTVEEVIQKSSNVGTTKIALQLPPQDMWEFYSRVGFGQAPKLSFPGAVSGRLRPWKTWKPIEQATMSYGHGLSVSLIQVARAYTIFARNGDLVPLTFFKQTEPVIGTPIISPQNAARIRKMLEMAAGPQGTAPKAQIMGYRVGGKTGTAHKQEKGVYVNKYISSFVGIAPMSNPRFVIAVMIDEASAGKYYGGDVAAPIFSELASGVLRAYQIPPDAPFRSVITFDGGVTESF